jgi:HSP20 family protein
MKLIKHAKEKSGPSAPLARGGAPLWPIRRLQTEIDRLFEEPFGAWLAPDVSSFEGWMPVVDVYEDKNNVYLKAEIPGMKKEEFEVYMSGENLNLAGERKVETEEKTTESYRSERYFGRFHRSIPLPVPVDAGKIDAHYRDGVLTITCPKTAEALRKQVEVKID